MLTKGWDTISIIKQDTINTQLKSLWDKKNADFSIDLEDGHGSISGTFDCFQITDGGGGKNLRLRLPILSGKLTIDGAVIALDGVNVVITVILTLLPSQNHVSILKTTYTKIVSESEIKNGQKGWIYPVTVTGMNKDASIYSQLILLSICKYLIEHPGQMELLFAEINFAKSSSPEWARPKKCAYSYLDTGYLAIMAVCDDRDISDLPLDVDISGIEMRSNSFYLMSGRMMMKNLILPGLTQLYSNAGVDDFQYSDGGFTNIKDLKMKQIKSGAIYYTPRVFKNQNVVKIESDCVRVNYDGDCDLKANLSMNWNGWVKMTPILSAGVLKFEKKSSDFYHSEDIPWYWQWLCLLIGAIVDIVVAVISDDLIQSIEQRGGSIAAGNIDTVTWCRRQSTVKTAEIKEALVLEYQ